MTDLELLDIMNGVKNEYILQTQTLRAQTKPAAPRPSRKPLLALLAAGLVLALAITLATRLLLR